MLNYLFALLPSFIHVFLRKRLGSTIGKNVKIKFGTLILSKCISIGENTTLGPFCAIKAETLSIGSNCSIKPITYISAKKVTLLHYVQVAPLVMISGDWTLRSSFEIGDHSRVFPFCWLDTGEGIKIGKQVGIGGHTLIFTHGVWTNFLEGGQVSYAGVEIEDNVWLPWRVFILPGVKIGAGTVVGANSVVNKSVEPNSLIAGSPAKVLKTDFTKQLTVAELNERAVLILQEFAKFDYKNNWIFDTNKITTKDFTIEINCLTPSKNTLSFYINTEKLNDAEFVAQCKSANIIYHPSKTVYINHNNQHITNFISFIRRYGIRLYINKLWH